MDTDVRIKWVDTDIVTESDYDFVVAPVTDPEWTKLSAEETDAEVNDIVQNVLAFEADKEEKISGMIQTALSSNEKGKKQPMMMGGVKIRRVRRH
jgi:hypothetical protein